MLAARRSDGVPDAVGYAAILMDGRVDLSRNEWEALLQMPLGVYSAVVEAGEEALEAQFRRFQEELGAGASAFPVGTTGATLVEALLANLDSLWAAFHASGRSPGDAVKRGVKVLRKVPDAESVALRDWLLLVAVHIAGASRIVGEDPVSPDEVSVIQHLASWVKRPVPAIAES